jgi:hypothetical protein
MWLLKFCIAKGKCYRFHLFTRRMFGLDFDKRKLGCCRNNVHQYESPGFERLDMVADHLDDCNEWNGEKHAGFRIECDEADRPEYDRTTATM